MVFFFNFNLRFYDLITVSLNSIALLCDIGILKFQNDVLIYCGEIDFALDKKVWGSRAINIIKASEYLAEILEDDVKNLYLHLRVIL